MSLIDESRAEIITEDPEDYRELVIQIWYPALPSPEVEPVPYFPEYREVGEILAGILKLPWFCFDHMRLVTSNSYLDAPLADDQDRFPIVVFNSGIFAGMVTQNTILMEELASHGYIAVSVAHSYECLAAIHPGGRVITVDLDRQDAFWAETETPEAKTLRGIYSTCMEPEEQRQLIGESMAALPLVNESIDIWVADLSFVLDELTAMDAGYLESPFRGRLDIDHIGVVGMSFGGTVAMEACRRDPRFRAGLNLEGQPLGMQVQEPYPVPFMIMRQANETYPLDMAYETAVHPIYRVTFCATRHLNFTDASIMAPIFGKKMGFVGAADGSLLVSRINSYAVTFFDRHLKNLDVPFPVITEPDRDPVIFESQNVDVPLPPQETIEHS